jgi:hypothetical protein
MAIYSGKDMPKEVGASKWRTSPYDDIRHCAVLVTVLYPIVYLWPRSCT